MFDKNLHDYKLKILITKSFDRLAILKCFEDFHPYTFKPQILLVNVEQARLPLARGNVLLVAYTTVLLCQNDKSINQSVDAFPI